jgi:hypothetical protein
VSVEPVVPASIVFNILSLAPITPVIELFPDNINFPVSLTSTNIAC